MARSSISLAGEWQIRHAQGPEEAWRPIAVPGCWETPDGPKDDAGPFWYRTTLTVPTEAEGRRIWLELDGVSYDCSVLVDGQPAGAHTGLWDAFEVELTGRVAPGATAELCLLVEKPAGLTAGPDSPPVAGRFPLRSTLAGFLPYVWGHIFGGVWQDVRLCVGGPARIRELHAAGGPDGLVRVEARCDGPPLSLELELIGPDGARVAAQTVLLDGGDGEARLVTAELRDPAPRPWSPRDPALYTLRARLGDDDARELRLGLRELRASGSDLLLNGAPVYPRMALSWGWYNDLLHCNPGEARIRAEFARLRELGYNGVKLCLWVPPQEYYAIADELGMLLWLELPMWLPQPSEHFLAQLPREYEAIVRQARAHPSVIIYTLGCELSHAVGPEILQPLFALVKRLAPDALLRDNSGSGEAYGGLLNEYAEFYDYHFYSDIHFFRPLIDYFTPRWRALQPWVFGEFCDLDTFRDLGRLAAGWAGRADAVDGGPWWASADPAVNPQGARWQFDVPFLPERMRAGRLWERAAELERLSHAHGLLHRKWTLETVRLYREIGGYVITGEVDTPISTAGMWDDLGEQKFDPAEFRGFNSDLVALVGWDKRRDWVVGGDRAAYWDSWCYAAGATVRPHIVASHYGAARGVARAAWELRLGDQVVAAGQLDGPELGPGDLRELGVAELRAPAVAAPQRAELRVALSVGGERAENRWPLWLFPAGPWAAPPGLALHDPRGLLAGLGQRIAGLAALPSADDAALGVARALITTEWTPPIARYVAQGGAALVLEQGEAPGGPLPTQPMPFWREAVRVAEPHPAWGDFPHDGWAGLQFYGCAADRALDLAGRPGARPILLRVDARTMATHAYIAELPIGRGRAIVSTLRFQGGHGDQPLGAGRNLAASYLLLCLARSLLSA